VLYSAKGVASIVAGGIAAALYERFGTWSACFYGSATLALVGAIAAFGLRSSLARRGVPLGVATAAK
jgi:hypothetical protein